jgi:hypothetical protein
MTKRDWIGPFFGVLFFIGGVVLLGITFRAAFDLFQKPPASVMLGKDGKTIDLNQAPSAVYELAFRSVMLLVMCVAGSMIASRGIKLYAASLHTLPEPKRGSKPKVESPSDAL